MTSGRRGPPRDELSRALEFGVTALLNDLRRKGSLDSRVELRINELVAT